MLRIMDVASALRRERETAESQLDITTAKARLRERLLATAQAAGEPVTDAEVDAAIERYFAEQHRYEDPPPSWRRFRANLWVMRWPIGIATGLVVAVTLGMVALANAVATPATPVRPHEAPVVAPRGSVPAPSSPVVEAPVVPPPVQQPQPAPQPAPPPVDPWPGAWQRWEQTMAAAQKLAADDGARARLAQVDAVAQAAKALTDLSRLRSAQRELEEVITRLEEEYVVTIVDRPGEKSGIDRYFQGRLSGYYLIVEAKTKDGSTLPRRIVNIETKSRHEVTKWGEEVPEEVWNRIVADKRADGVVDEAVFARKARGSTGEVVVLPDGRGRPLERGRSITQW